MGRRGEGRGEGERRRGIAPVGESESFSFQWIWGGKCEEESLGGSFQSLLFYRTMHYSAKHGIAIACRPSVTLADQDHISWKSWKLTARTISPTPSLFVAQRPSPYSQGNMGKFWVEYRWGGEDPVELDSSPTL